MLHQPGGRTPEYRCLVPPLRLSGHGRVPAALTRLSHLILCCFKATLVLARDSSDFEGRFVSLPSLPEWLLRPAAPPRSQPRSPQPVSRPALRGGEKEERSLAKRERRHWWRETTGGGLVTPTSPEKLPQPAAAAVDVVSASVTASHAKQRSPHAAASASRGRGCPPASPALPQFADGLSLGPAEPSSCHCGVGTRGQGAGSPHLVWHWGGTGRGPHARGAGVRLVAGSGAGLGAGHTDWVQKPLQLSRAMQSCARPTLSKP